MKRFILSLLAIGAMVSRTTFAQDSAPEENALIENFECRGNDSTDCSFLTNHLYVNSGDPVDEEKLKNGQLRLETLPNLKSARVFLEKGSEKGKVKVVIEIVESNPFHAEFRAGTGSWNSRTSQSLSLRFSHDNLFQSGKILDFYVDNKFRLDGPTKKSLTSRLQYVDPNFFGQKKYFLSTGATYNHSDFLYEGREEDLRHNYRYRANELGFDLSLGYRFGEFSYVSLGYLLNPISDLSLTETKDSPYPSHISDTFKEKHYQSRYAYLLNYGWNSEDDPYFTTRGSRFSANFLIDPEDDFSLRLSYRTTWKTADDSIWTFFAGNPGNYYDSYLSSAHGWGIDDMFMGLTFARDLHSDSGDRRRFYASAGFANSGFDQRLFSQPALKVGLKSEIKDWGHLDLFLFYSQQAGTL